MFTVRGRKYQKFVGAQKKYYIAIEQCAGEKFHGNNLLHSFCINVVRQIFDDFLQLTSNFMTSFTLIEFGINNQITKYSP